ncbi:hypothetical protein GCM10009550_35820 [Actinocorallia libanotica]|uniref:Uncharacterized protein n=1 Tax=Actinocorallia libanotica TaxID=46162 RepID=A0ABP4BQS7_9ACTN
MEIVGLLAEQTGGPLDPRWVAKVHRELLDERDGVRDLRTYVLAAIRKEPGRYAPRSGPWQDPVPDVGLARPELAKSAAAHAREQYPNLRHHRQLPSEEAREEGAGDN